MVEFHLLDESQQGLKLLVRLAGVANDEGGPHSQVVELRPGVIHESAGHLNIARPVHRAQDGLIGVLDRHVQIGQERLVLCHHIHHS